MAEDETSPPGERTTSAFCEVEVEFVPAGVYGGRFAVSSVDVAAPNVVLPRTPVANRAREDALPIARCPTGTTSQRFGTLKVVEPSPPPYLAPHRAHSSGYVARESVPPFAQQ